jgi:hypothetical protein
VRGPQSGSNSAVSEAHWRKLIISFQDKVVWYVEPFGSRLRAGHAIIKSFDETLGAIADDWCFLSIEVRMQSDGCSCGIWDHIVDRAFVAYVDSDALAPPRSPPSL